MISLLQKGLDKALRWGEENGLSFSPSKTVAVVFTHSTKGHSGFPHLKMGATMIEYSNSVKYLGVRLDSKLTFKAHLEEISKKALRLLMAAKSVMNKLRGLSPISSR